MVYGARANPLGGVGGGGSGSAPALAPAPAPAAQLQTRPPSADEQRKLDDAQAAFDKAELDLKVLEEDEKTLKSTIEVDKNGSKPCPPA